ncbi:UNVERIFIED_CONTAM: hypothetical protein FKN15_030141 [Acipenser sinensis]
MLPNMDHPEAFGQHPNADIASQIREARTLFETLLSLQPQLTTSTGAGGQSREEKAYPSLKPLGSWTRDLVQRVEQFAKWAETAHPPVLFWLSGFTFPTGFLTAVLQASARLNNISVDTLSWEFIVSTVDDNNLLFPPKDGVFVKGLFLEGAGWDQKNSSLVEAQPMQLVCPIPTIHFKPVENKKKSGKGTYACPCYYFPNRAGLSGRASFVVGVDLKSGAMQPDHWIKRGTALLMSLDS